MEKRRPGRPWSSNRDDITVKLDRKVASQARYLAESRGIPLSEYLSEILRPFVLKDFLAATKHDDTKT